MKAWFISDIHLQDVNERNGITLLRFLHSLKEDSKATHLFLLGDIFDLWVGDSNFFQKKFQALVDVIVELKDKGIEIAYFEGNHDLHIKNFWENNFAIPVWAHEKTYQLGPWKVRMEHGDFINERDMAYKRLRSFLRHPILERTAYAVPGKLWSELGNAASKISRKHSSAYRHDREKELREMIRSYAKRKFKEDSFDFIITGHMHIKDEFTFEAGGRNRTSINLGSWFEEPTALCLDESGTSWKALT